MERKDWQLDALKDVLKENVKEKRRERRRKFIWSLIKVAFFVFVIWLVFFSKDHMSGTDSDFLALNSPHLAKIKMEGEIKDDSLYANASSLIDALRSSFKNKHTVGVVLLLNSPGGSAVQSNQVYLELMRLRKKHPQKKVYAVVSDICASGCYFIASAADKIIADELSLVGSIGAIYSGFGLHDLIEKIGVKRRVLTAGKHKSFMDPFAPLTDWETNAMQEILDDTHNIFISKVKEGRGGKLANNPDLFSGRIWLGTQAKELGLVDLLGDINLVFQEAKTRKVVDYTKDPDVVQKFLARMFVKAEAPDLDDTKSIGKAMNYLLTKATLQSR